LTTFTWLVIGWASKRVTFREKKEKNSDKEGYFRQICGDFLAKPSGHPASVPGTTLYRNPGLVKVRYYYLIKHFLN